MGTRSGNIDPALIPFIMQKTGQNAEEVLNVLNKESGLLGISGTSSDLRDLESDAEEGKERAQLALDVFASRIHKYIGSYATRMHGVDVIVFTAGVGENSSTVRAKVLEGLEFMGILRKMKQSVVKKDLSITHTHQLKLLLFQQMKKL